MSWDQYNEKACEALELTKQGTKWILYGAVGAVVMNIICLLIQLLAKGKLHQAPTFLYVAFYVCVAGILTCWSVGLPKLWQSHKCFKQAEKLLNND